MSGSEREQRVRRGAAQEAAKEAAQEAAGPVHAAGAGVRPSNAARPKAELGPGRDSRAVREAGANRKAEDELEAADTDKDKDKDKEEDEDKEEEEAKASDLFWKHLVWAAWRSRKRREDEGP